MSQVHTTSSSNSVTTLLGNDSKLPFSSSDIVEYWRNEESRTFIIFSDKFKETDSSLKSMCTKADYFGQSSSWMVTVRNDCNETNWNKLKDANEVYPIFHSWLLSNQNNVKFGSAVMNKGLIRSFLLNLRNENITVGAVRILKAKDPINATIEFAYTANKQVNQVIVNDMQIEIGIGNRSVFVGRTTYEMKVLHSKPINHEELIISIMEKGISQVDVKKLLSVPNNQIKTKFGYLSFLQIVNLKDFEKILLLDLKIDDVDIKFEDATISARNTLALASNPHSIIGKERNVLSSIASIHLKDQVSMSRISNMLRENQKEMNNWKGTIDAQKQKIEFLNNDLAAQATQISNLHDEIKTIKESCTRNSDQILGLQNNYDSVMKKQDKMDTMMCKLDNIIERLDAHGASSQNSSSDQLDYEDETMDTQTNSKPRRSNRFKPYK